MWVLLFTIEFMVPINYIAVLVCAVAAMALGFLWYGQLFSKQWIALMGFTPEHMAEAQKKGMAKQYGIQFVGALLMAFVLAHSIIFAGAYLNVSGISAGLLGALWSWLGFVAPATIGIVLRDGKPWKLWFINAGYFLVLLLVMGLIIGLWM